MRTESDARIGNQLVDVLSQIPTTLQGLGDLAVSDSDSRRATLVSQIGNLFSRTDAWRSQWTILNRQPSEISRNHVAGPTQPIVFLDVPVCSGWAQATEVCLYNVITLTLLSILWSIERGRSMSSQSGGPSLSDPISMLEKAAMTISNNMESQLALERSSYGIWPRDTQCPIWNGNNGAFRGVKANLIVRGL
jgi:hypothetical protein